MFAAPVLAAVFLSGCGGGGKSDRRAYSAPSSTATASGATTDVEIKLIAFKPDHLTIPAGTTVTWHQRDPGVHTVTSGTVQQEAGGVRDVPDGMFDSGQLATDKSYARKFSNPGTFTYFCKIHPATMRGQITVT
jgi:plastocyanin